MNPQQIPFVRIVSRFGIKDSVLTGFMIAGPVVILALALVGRTAVMITIAAAYVGLFVLYVMYKGVVTSSK